ncbi:MAG: hypothetical protein ACKOUT_06825 [Novosphingobium sp.]
MNRFTKAALCLGMFSISAIPAYAGSPVTGSGSTPSEAMNDANNRAQVESQRRWGKSTCITQATYERCRRDQYGYWICTAFVNNEAGSSC